jgi:acetyltransferase AlgX (SGNH hydrolase-like protein)
MRSLHKPGALMFLAALMTPATVQLLSDRTTVSVAEKRTLEPMPAWPRRRGEWSDFPGGLDRFLRDHFGLREPLATGWSLFKYALRYTPRVAVGREGWLYFPQYWGPKYGARTCGSLSEALLSFADRLDRLAAYAATSGVPLVFAVAPDKETLYPEYMPEKADTRSHCDLFAELRVALEGERHLKTVDLQAPLETGKARERVYFKTDSHWNDAGSWRVARALLEGSCASPSACPELPEPSLSTKTTSGDLAAFIGLGSVLTEQTVAVEVPRGKHAGRRLTVVGDSFAKTLPRFLAADASVASVSFQDHAMGRIDLRRVMAAKPDAILIVIVERYLYDPELLRSFAAGF